MAKAAAIIPRGSNSGLEISFATNVAEIANGFRELDRWAVPYITAAALTDVAVGGRDAEKKAMPFYLDRPVAYTQRGIRYEKATKDHLVARVYVNDEAPKGTPQSTYLEPNVRGGARRAKPFELRLRRAGILLPNEFVVPGAGAKLNAAGNLSGGDIERMLSQLGAAEQFAGYQANETKRSRKKNRGRVSARYFIARGDTALPRGIWERNGRRLRPFLIFVQRAPVYGAVYKFGEATMDHAEFHFARYWARRFDAMVKSGRIFRGSGQLTRGG